MIAGPIVHKQRVYFWLHFTVKGEVPLHNHFGRHIWSWSLGPRGGPRGQHERGEAVAAAGQVDGGAAAKQHLR